MTDREQNSGGVNPVVKRVVGIAVVIALVVGWKLWNKSDSNVEAANALRTWVASATEYEANKVYIDGLFDAQHSAAFDASYTSRRRGSSFDTDKYVRMVFEGMINRARADGKAAVADSIQSVYQQYQRK